MSWSARRHPVVVIARASRRRPASRSGRETAPRARHRAEPVDDVREHVVGGDHPDRARVGSARTRRTISLSAEFGPGLRRVGDLDHGRGSGGLGLRSKTTVTSSPVAPTSARADRPGAPSPRRDPSTSRPAGCRSRSCRRPGSALVALAPAAHEQVQPRALAAAGAAAERVLQHRPAVAALGLLLDDAGHPPRLGRQAHGQALIGVAKRVLDDVRLAVRGQHQVLARPAHPVGPARRQAEPGADPREL